MEWYWKVVPLLLTSTGRVLALIIMFEFAIAQSPDRMKGFVIGMMIAFMGIGQGISLVLNAFLRYSFCYDAPMLLLQMILFLVVLFLSKHYTLRERNREVNIQAIAEEHFERYLDQEEEYMKERHY